MPAPTKSPANSGGPPAVNPRQVAVQTRELRKVFGSLVAVQGFTLSIARGEVFGLLGPNGSGKTTTIRMLCGLLSPSGGDATVAGFDVRRDAERIRQVIGYMSQKYGLYDDLTVQENLRFYSTVYGLHGTARDERTGALMRELGLDARATQLAERRMETKARACLCHRARAAGLISG